MDYLYYSVLLFNFTTFAYLLGAILLTIYLVKKKQFFLKSFQFFAVAVVLAHTTALLLRWMQAGFDRPPWTNLYESLIFFSWGLGVIATVVVLRYKTYFLTTILYPLTFAGLGLASLVPDKSITPLVPSLQSYWIKIHVVMAVVAYPAFIIAGAISLAYLFKSKTKIEKLNIGFSFVAAFFLALVGGTKMIFEQIYEVPKMFLQNGRWVKIPIDPNAQPIEWLQTTIPWAGLIFLFTILFYLLTMIYSFGALKDTVNPLWNKLRKVFNVFGFGSFTALLGVIYYNMATRSDLALNANPYEMAILWCVYGVQILFLAYSYFRDGIDSLLPQVDWLEEFAYKMTLFAFPFMTLLLITGAIWAYSAWGRYWGWDPKETCALMTWLIFAGYLHSRAYFGTRGRVPAVISVIGAVSVFFTFLGANLLLSGLHSYGAQ